MRTAGAPRIPGDGIPSLRYLHLVRAGEPDVRFDFHIDLHFRSQTSWIWLETKLVELGMVGSDKNYKASRATDDSENCFLFLTQS